MNTFDTDLKKYTDKVRLKASERRELRERVFSYMEYHPLTKQETSITELRGSIMSERFITLHFTRTFARIVGGVAIVLFVVAPFAAERAVPGDVLYLVKTGVNETVQGSLANSPYEKIEFETKLMERRITEARVLASEGKLTEETKQQITETVKEHTTAVQQGLAELRVEDAESAALAQISFSSALEVQSAVLGADEDINDDALVESILTVVNTAHEEVAQSSEDTMASYEGLVAQVERETTRAFELFASIKESATKEEIDDIDRRLSDINRLTDEAKSAYEAHPEVAVDDIMSTLSLTQKLIAFMSDIDVRETVALADLVPIMLSDAERIDIARSELEALAGLKVEIEERLLVIEDAGLIEKVNTGLTQIDTLMLQTQVALDINDIPNAEGSVIEARSFMTDIDVLTQQAIPEVAEVPTDTGEEGTTTPETNTEESETEDVGESGE